MLAHVRYEHFILELDEPAEGTDERCIVLDSSATEVSRTKSLSEAIGDAKRRYLINQSEQLMDQANEMASVASGKADTP